jgi:hypothetical protein
MNQYDVIIKKLTDKIGELSKEAAFYYSLVVQAQEENKKLQHELTELKSKNE